MKVKKYKPVHPTLKKLIKHIWINCGDSSIIDHKLLPIRNIDLVINLSPQPIVLYDNVAELRLKSCYFTGLMDHYKYSWKKKAGKTELIGISFYPTGFYPFFGVPLLEFKNQIIDLYSLNKNLSERIVERLRGCKTTFEKLSTLEEELLSLLQYDLIIDNKMNSLVLNFMKGENLNIKRFCQAQGIHRRRFERFVNKVLGMNPKAYLKVNRFRGALRTLQNQGYNTLTEVAYQCGYYDQMHFIKEFKLFTGSSPTQFLAEKKALSQICKF